MAEAGGVEIMNQVLDTHRETTLKVLQGIIDRFNEDFREWHEISHCTANFSWKYDAKNCKMLTISEIDLPVYRSEGPNGQSLESLIRSYEEKSS